MLAVLCIESSVFNNLQTNVFVHSKPKCFDVLGDN